MVAEPMLAGCAAYKCSHMLGPMTFTVVRAVRETELTVSEPGGQLRGRLHQAVPMRPAAMELPYAEQTIRLDFTSADFSETIPDDLS